jgi:hypothetical protein
MNLDVPVLSIHGRPIRLGVALGVARLAAALDDDEREVCELLRSAERAIATGAIPSQGRIEALLRAWRRDHRLSAAAATRAWLLRHGMSLDDVRRLLVLEEVHPRFGAAGNGVISAETWALVDDELPRFLAFKFRLEGVLELVAERLVGAESVEPSASTRQHEPLVRARLASRYESAASALGRFGVPRDGITALLEIEARYQHFRELACSAERLDQELERSFRRHVRVVFDYLSFARESPALEAAALARDGWELAAVARANGFELRSRDSFLGEVADPVIAERLGCHVPGEVFGPHVFEGEHTVFELHARYEPNTGDARVRKRLGASVERAVLKPKVDASVRVLYRAFDALGQPEWK